MPDVDARDADGNKLVCYFCDSTEFRVVDQTEADAKYYNVYECKHCNHWAYIPWKDE